MAQFSYRARRRGGDLVEGELEAVSASALADQLLGSGLFPVRIEPLSARGEANAPRRRSLGEYLRSRRGVGLDDLILLARQLHTLTRSGVPILRALRGLAETSRSPALARALRGVLESLESGHDFATALGRHPAIFPPLFCGMVQVGEHTGKLEEAFAQLAEYLEQEKETRDRVKAALRYPTLVIGAISVAIVVITLLVIPAFEKVFRGFRAELPLPTRIILGISHFAQDFWPWLLLVAVAGFFALRQLLRTEAGRLWWDLSKLRFPLVGSIVLRATLARFSRAFAMSFHAGVPLVQSLQITGRAVDNAFVTTCLEKMRDGIERGDTLNRCAETTGLFTPLVLQMLSVGEETGQIDSMLHEVADFYTREVDYDMKRLAATIEPVLTVVIGGMVLVLALGVFLPMWNLAGVARGGG